jgi:predicted acyltransferase
MSADADAATPAPVPQRLLSLDALRGFDMFWIIGADEIVNALHQMAGGDGKSTGFSIIGFLAYELDHADWVGFHFEDLIFPLFVFMAGISIVFSLGKIIRQEGRGAAVCRILRRAILLYALGLFYYGGLSNHWPGIRMTGVLNRIALCYMFAGLLFCFCNLRTMIAVAVALLVTYWALMTFVPIRDIQLQKTALEELARKRGVSDDPKALFYGTTDRVSGKFGHGYNLCDHFDFQYLPGRHWDIYFDPEGILSTMPAVVTCLLGVFAGFLLLDPGRNDQQKVVLLLAGGLALAALGWAWSAQFPVIKKIWTSSYVLVAGGYSALLLGVFYWVIEVAGCRRWCQPFVWMGMNSITVYMTADILDGFGGIAKRFVGGDIHDFLDTHAGASGDLVLAAAGLVLAFWYVHFLYRRKIFLRL